MCRCRKGFCSAVSPPIHIFAGEKVCIQAMRPTQFCATFASVSSASISSGVFTTGLNTSRHGTRDEQSSAATIFCEFSATCASVSGPYRCWLPVTNQTSDCFRLGIKTTSGRIETTRPEEDTAKRASESEGVRATI